MKNYKKDFPIFKHNKGLVYLDSAATSQKPQFVLDAMMDYYNNYNSNVRRGLYPIAEKATKRVEEVRGEAAGFINAKHSEEIIFVRNTTEGLNLIAYSFASHNISSKDVILTTVMEHHSNFVPWQQVALKTGASFEVLDIDENFQLSLPAGKEEIFNSQTMQKIKRAKILALTHVSNVLGTINPIKEIIKKLRGINSELIIIVDAAQSVPHMKVDVQELDCDFLAFSMHKSLGATGVGVLYGKKKHLESMEPFLYGGEMIQEVTIKKTTFAPLPYKFEAGTPDIAGIISLGAAIEYLKSTGMKNVRKHELELLAYSFELLDKIGGIEIYGPRYIQKRGGVISFNVDGVHAHDVAQVLGDLGVCIRSGHHCAMPLHTRLGIQASARISFYLYNDFSDIDAFIQGIKKVKKIFKV